MSPRTSRLLLAAGFVVVALVCARLGFWQLSRLRERRASNAAALAKRSAPPIRLGGGTLPDTGLVNRRVMAAGRYDHAHEVVLRGKAYDGSPGVEVVTPLLIEGGRWAVLVNRGFLPAPDAVTVNTDSLSETGRVRVSGIAIAVPSGGGAPLTRNGRTTWGRLDLDAVGKHAGYPIAAVYIRQSPDSALPRFPRRLEAPLLDDGPHLSYAIQWFAFAIIAMVFGTVVVKEKRER